MKRPLILGTLALAVLVGLVFDRWTSSAGRPAAFADAQRIWWDHARVTEPDAPAPGAAFSFWMVRDFGLDAEDLARGTRGARLVLLGDPEILVYWNGVLVHSTHYRVGEAAEVLDVSLLLRANNRVVLEARSDHGDGGVMAALWLDDLGLDGGAHEATGPSAAAGEPVWVTDEQWLATRRFEPGLRDAWLPPDAKRLEGHLHPVRSWATLDLGRWQPLRVSPELVQPTWPSARQSRRLPDRMSPFDPEQPDLGSTPAWPRGWVVDFGETVEGCLALRGDMAFARRAHFVEAPGSFTDLHGPVEFATQHDLGPGYRESWVLPLPGSGHWLDAVPRRFRAVLLEGDPGGAGPDPREVWVQPCAGPGEPARPARLFRP